MAAPKKVTAKAGAARPPVAKVVKVKKEPAATTKKVGYVAGSPPSTERKPNPPGAPSTERARVTSTAKYAGRGSTSSMGQVGLSTSHTRASYSDSMRLVNEGNRRYVGENRQNPTPGAGMDKRRAVPRIERRRRLVTGKGSR